MEHTQNFPNSNEKKGLVKKLGFFKAVSVTLGSMYFS
jgi:hypothetical protein